MAIPLTVNGVPFSYPQQGDVGYAAQATAWAQAITNGVLQLGGAYTLLSDLDLSGFGIKAPYFTSKTANPAQTGVLRLAKTDAVKFRNNANSADLAGLGLNAQDNLTANGTQLDGQPTLRAIRQTSDQTLISAATTIIFNGTVTDSDSAYNNATGIYTVPTGKGGTYLISTSIATAQVTAAGLQVVTITAGGLTRAFGGTNAPVAAGSLAVSTSCFVVLSAGDQIFVQLSTTGGTCNALQSTGTQLSIKRLV